MDATFAGRPASALSQFGPRGSFKVEITLGVIMVIGTLGAGATVASARMGHRVGQFSVRALELIVKLSRTFEKWLRSRI